MSGESLRTAVAAVAMAAGCAAGAGAQQPGPRPGSTGWLVSAAVLALPPSLRDGAEVRTPAPGQQLTVLRKGSNGIICLADLATDEEFSSACYSGNLEPFMERGRELRRQGVDGLKNSETRWREIEQAKLKMPPTGVVYNLRLPTDKFDPGTTDPATGGRLHAVYIPGATTATTGLPDQPGDGPWLMNAGTPGAHIMIALPAKKPSGK